MLPRKKKIILTLIILVYGIFAVNCVTTEPFTHIDTFNINSDHYREIRRGPWEVIGKTDYQLIFDHDEKIIHLRGGETGKGDNADNFDFRTRRPAEDWFPDTEGVIKIHYGFLRQYSAVRGTLLDAAYQYPDYAIRVSGYSLGSSWTQIFLMDVITHWPDRDVHAILYSPANPWRRLPKKYQLELEKRTIFVYPHWDPVTWMAVAGFHRYGQNIVIGKWWRFLPIQHNPRQVIRALDEI